MQRTFNSIDWNELNQPPCEILRGTDANNKLIELGLDITEGLQQAFRLANNAYALRKKINPSRAMGRWGDICEHAATALETFGWSLIYKNRQPCLVHQAKNVQLIFMSPLDEAFGNELNVITSKCHKGHSTELKLLANKSHYADANFFRTFIVYYQPSTLLDLENSDFLPFEIAYATGIYKVSSEGEKTKCYPINHTLRLIVSDSPNAPEAYEAPIPDENNPITEDDFGDLQAI
jgi:hypothetical protein